jgi:pimeloyl-ACP methyl ester carboxylesterase
MTIVGESWGSALAIMYAAAHPNAVEKLVLLGPSPPTRAMMERRLDESDAAMGMRKRLTEIRRAMPGSEDPIAACREFFWVYTRQFFGADRVRLRRGACVSGDDSLAGSRSTRRASPVIRASVSAMQRSQMTASGSIDRWKRIQRRAPAEAR